MDQPDDIAGRIMLVVDAALPAAARETCEEAAASLAQRTGVPVTLATVPIETLDAVQPLVRRGPTRIRELAPPVSRDAATMGAAPFVWREGRPDWGAMWTTFCELALYGGPPHRGIEDALEAPQTDSDTMVINETIMELRRGIHETTGLYSEPAPPNWLAVTCHSKKMAAWMAASIILENVDAKCEDEILYVPCSPDFDLKNQVKSVI